MNIIIFRACVDELCQSGLPGYLLLKKDDAEGCTCAFGNKNGSF